MASTAKKGLHFLPIAFLQRLLLSAPCKKNSSLKNLNEKTCQAERIMMSSNNRAMGFNFALEK